MNHNENYSSEFTSGIFRCREEVTSSICEASTIYWTSVTPQDAVGTIKNNNSTIAFQSCVIHLLNSHN